MEPESIILAQTFYLVDVTLVLPGGWERLERIRCDVGFPPPWEFFALDPRSVLVSDIAILDVEYSHEPMNHLRFHRRSFERPCRENGYIGKARYEVRNWD